MILRFYFFTHAYHNVSPGQTTTSAILSNVPSLNIQMSWKYVHVIVSNDQHHPEKKICPGDATHLEML